MHSDLTAKMPNIFSFIVFLIAASALNIPGNTYSTALPLPNTSICAVKTITCECLHRYNQFKIHNVDGCSDTKEMCIRHMKDKCIEPATRLLESPCVQYIPEAPRGPPNVTCSQIVSDSFEGEKDVTFTCYIKSKTLASAQWLFRGESISKRIESGFYGSFNSKNPSIICHRPAERSILKLYSIKQDAHQGYYTLIAQNQFGQANWTIRMNVRGKTKPGIKIFCDKAKKAYLGASFNITCHAFFPLNNIPGNARYRRGKIRVKDDSRHTLHQEESMFIMMISNVSEDDAGIWEFRATQYPSNKNASIELHVVACPKGHYCPLNESTARPCPSGTYNDGKRNIAHFCQPCPNQLTSDDSKIIHIGARSIEVCPKIGSSSSNRNESSTNKTITVFSVAASVVVILLVFILLWAFCRRKRRSKELSIRVSDVDDDIQLIYDVFISFSEKDHAFGQRLHSTIEDQGYRCCYHHRDFVPGESIVQNIADAVYRSKVTLVVLSPSYLDSKFCKHELRQALTAAVERRRILPVLYKSCTNGLPRELSSLTYIEYKSGRESDFWRKLSNTLKNFCSVPNGYTEIDSKV